MINYNKHLQLKKGQEHNKVNNTFPYPAKINYNQIIWLKTNKNLIKIKNLP